MKKKILILAGNIIQAGKCAEVAGLTRTDWSYVYDHADLFGQQDATVELWRYGTFYLRNDLENLMRIANMRRLTIIDKTSEREAA